MSKGARGRAARSNPVWQPLVEVDPIGATLEEGQTMWQNNLYTALCRPVGTARNGESVIWLSIRRNDRAPAREWRHFQRIKNQLAGPEYEAVELYPAESRKVDGANQYHLWCFPEPLPFGFHERIVLDSEGAATEAPGAVQAPHEPIDLAHGGLSEASTERMRLRDSSSVVPDPVNPQRCPQSVGG